MVVCSTLKDSEEISVEYAYTPNEISYIRDIESIKSELNNLTNPEIILQKETQLKILKDALRSEQRAFLEGIDIITNLLRQLIFKKEK